jgi:cytochrome c oxidase assembly protein subunit 15
VNLTPLSHKGAGNIGLHRLAVFTACCTLVLVFIGGLVTSTASGLSVPDWPTTYGWNMFTFPVSKWVGGIVYEHGHRLAASLVGFLTLILVIYAWLIRSPARLLALAALAAIILQGILGGITVLFLLPAPISTLHACLAQTYFCLMIAFSLITSPTWKRELPPIPPQKGMIQIQTLCAATTGAVYLQLILGALMRHTGSGLAIPDFPLAFGQMIPSFSSEKIIIHFAHRLGATVASGMIIWTFSRIVRRYRNQRALVRPVVAMLIFLGIQISLGALAVWTSKAVIPATAHVAIGAIILGTSVLLTLRAYAMASVEIPALSCNGSAKALVMDNPLSP